MLDQSQDRLQEIVDTACQKVDIHDTQNFPANLDISLDKWAEAQGLSDESSKDGLKFFVYTILSRDLGDIGLHYFLDYIKSGGNFKSFALDTEKGAQHLKIKQGMFSQPHSETNSTGIAR